MDSANKISILCLFFSFCLLKCSAIRRGFSIVGYSEEDLTSRDSLIDLFELWMDKHAKFYDSFKEKLRRFEILKDNLKHIDETNRRETSCWLGLHEFAGMSREEFKEKFFGLKPVFSKRREQDDFMYENAGNLPKSVDWRKKGAVTYVKNQGQCGKKNYPSVPNLFELHNKAETATDTK